MENYGMRHLASSDRKTPLLAIIGCGLVSKLGHAPALEFLSRHGLCKVTYLVDPNLNRAREIQMFFPQARCVKSIDELDLKQLDMAIVATHHRLHEQLCRKLLGAGLHVLCEKPFCSSASEAKGLVELASKNDLLLGVGLLRRFAPWTAAVREILQAETFGKLISFDFSEGRFGMWPTQEFDFVKRETSRYGVFLQLGIHITDLLIHWFGLPERFELFDDCMGGLDVNASLQAEFANGSRGTLRLSFDRSTKQRLFFQFEKAWIACDTVNFEKLEFGLKGSTALESYLCRKVWFREIPQLSRISASFSQLFVYQLLNFFAALNREEDLLVSAEAALSSMQFIESCYAQSKLMKMAWLSSEEEERALALRGAGL
ncbi:MAG: Gfo/Idh/MocA family oxidoreductase [Candidatus Obscuribacterales bacterium]|nr:Gfo/Idh/MocA family oxidoreductase [Candidatus Obscuribacterales bacterium]